MRGKGVKRKVQQRATTAGTTAAKRKTRSAEKVDEEAIEVVNLMPEVDGEQTATSQSGTSAIDFQQLMNETGLLPSTSNVHAVARNDMLISPLSAANMSAGAEPMVTMADDMFIHVPLTLRQQIWRGEYINIAILLKGAVELGELCKPGSLRMSSAGYLEAGPKQCRDKVKTIEAWSDAFLIFMALWLVNDPTKGPEMIRYMSLIREIANRHGGSAWSVYDEQFRLRQASKPTPWGVINNDLWMRCVSFAQPIVNANRQFVQGPSNQGVERSATCHEFNAKGSCGWPQCRFAHNCAQCGQGHGKWECPQLARNNTQAPQQSFPFRGKSTNRFQRRGFWANRGNSFTRK